MKQNFKLPDGEFTHTELAQFNGVRNQQIWGWYDQGMKEGWIVRLGRKSGHIGKGPASFIHRANFPLVKYSSEWAKEMSPISATVQVVKSAVKSVKSFVKSISIIVPMNRNIRETVHYNY